MWVQYDGTDFCGWQSQRNGVSLQDALEAALGRLLGTPAPRLFAAGRTDAGVHAAAMPVHFDTDHPIPAARLPYALPRFLPRSIVILAADEAPPGFDARRSARLRWYRYQVLCSALPRPLGPRAWHVHRPLDLAAVEEGLARLRGRHDFNGFRSSHCQAKRTVLDLNEARLTRVALPLDGAGAWGAGELLAFDFKCRSFLHHMIRFLTGTLIALGEGTLDIPRLLRILEHGDRPQLIHCAPPHGLCLMGAAYDEDETARLLAACPVPPSF
jgi:tRNA pseudouridine38-40 synthase